MCRPHFSALAQTRISRRTSFKKVTQHPEILGLLGLYQSRNSLLYALGQEAVLREEASVTEEDTPERVADLFTLLASQPASDNLHGPVIFNDGELQCFVTRVQGVRVTVHHGCSETAILAAEAVIGSVEALFATVIELDAAAHTENFTISMQEVSDSSTPAFTVDREEMTASVSWRRVCPLPHMKSRTKFRRC